jgi:CelD/BcsL family acetyltransferase involved in cellulose biosynthesis
MTALAQAPRAVGALPHEGPTADRVWSDICLETFALRPHPIEVEGARAPLALVDGRLETIGASQLFEPTDFTWRDGDALDRLVAAIAAERRPLRLPRMPAGSPAVGRLARTFRLLQQRPSGACPVVPVVEDPERRLGARRRQDLRRARRRAEARGQLRTDVHEPAPDEVEPLLDVAFAVEARSWKGRAGSALSDDTLRGRFYRAYGRSAATAGMLRIAFLRIDDQPVATQIAIERAGALWLLKIGYDERYAACSPGQLLMAETLRWAAERGLERCEMLGTAAPWTRMWAEDAWPCTTVYAYPLNARGAAAALQDSVRATTRALRR